MAVTARKQQEISDKIKLIPAMMNQVAEHDKHFAEQDKWQERVEKTIYGNGEPGMDERLRNIERSLKLLLQLAWVMVATVGGYGSLELFKIIFSR
jgi:hypothetical protein